MEHYNYIMNPRGDWASLRSFAFVFWLGFNVKSALVNFTQVPLVGYPYLAARFGDLTSLNALKKAAQALPKMYNAKTGDVSDELLLALDRGQREGVIDESQASELAGLAQGNYVSTMIPGNKVHKSVIEFNRASAWMFQSAEKINRRTVFRAAWELARDNNDGKYIDKLVRDNPEAFKEMISEGFTQRDARAYLVAKDVTRQTQFHYSREAQPKFMRGKKGALFVFYQFAQQSLYFAARQPGRGRYLLMMLAIAGLEGLPGAEDMLAIVKFLGKKVFGSGFDPEKEAMEFIRDLTNGTIPPDLITPVSYTHLTLPTILLV